MPRLSGEGKSTLVSVLDWCRGGLSEFVFSVFLPERVRSGADGEGLYLYLDPAFFIGFVVDEGYELWERVEFFQGSLDLVDVESGVVQPLGKRTPLDSVFGLLVLPGKISMEREVDDTGIDGGFIGVIPVSLSTLAIGTGGFARLGRS